MVFYKGDYGCQKTVGLRLAVDVGYDVCGFQMVVPLKAFPQLLQVSLEHLGQEEAAQHGSTSLVAKDVAQWRGVLLDFTSLA